MRHPRNRILNRIMFTVLRADEAGSNGEDQQSQLYLQYEAGCANDSDVKIQGQM